MSRLIVPLASVLAVACAGHGYAADAPSPKAFQIGIAYSAEANCKGATVGIDDLGRAYFGAGQLQQVVAQILTDCDTTIKGILSGASLEPYKMIVFLAKPTPNAPPTVVGHFLYNAASPLHQGATSIPGIKRLTWIYVTEDPLDSLVSQITVTPLDNPVLAQLGGLFAALEKPLEKVSLLGTRRAGVHDLVLHIAPSVDLVNKRSAIAQIDFISTPKRDASSNMLDSTGKTTTDAKQVAYLQVPGTFTIANTPHTWLTVNAAAGILVGSVSGDQQMKVDNKMYASNPLSTGVAMAGVTFHVPFDSSSSQPTWQEVVGLFVGGVVSPTGGLGVGASVGWKGIALTVGYAALLVQTAPEGHAVGTAVPDGLNPQLVRGMSGSAFVAGSYAFK
jgi:hypothetical protein